MDKSQAESFAAEWIAAWNSHDLERILAHYAEDVELISPMAARLIGAAGGGVAGKAALRRYFEFGLSKIPDLRFRLLDLFWGVSGILIIYGRDGGGRTGEFMELRGGLIARVVATYDRDL